LRQVDQLRTDMANLEAGQEFLMQQINRLPTARDLWRAATLIGLIGAVFGIVGVEAAPSTCLVGVTGGRRLASSIGNSLATRAADLGPDLKCLGSGSSVLGSSDVIAAEME
jgi:hypothetical protein